MRLGKRCNFAMWTACMGGGGPGVLPRNNFENQECRRSHIRSFCKAFKISNLPDLSYAYLQLVQRRKSPLFFLLNVFEHGIEVIMS